MIFVSDTLPSPHLDILDKYLCSTPFLWEQSLFTTVFEDFSRPWLVKMQGATQGTIDLFTGRWSWYTTSVPLFSNSVIFNHYAVAHLYAVDSLMVCLRTLGWSVGQLGDLSLLSEAWCALLMVREQMLCLDKSPFSGHVLTLRTSQS